MSAKEFKVVLAGQFGSGRTAFASRFTSAKSDKKKIAAIKTEVFPVSLYTSAGSATLKLYDTLVHAKGGLPEHNFFQADACLLFFDTTKEASYEALTEWYDAIVKANGRKGSEPLPIIIVGTKVDDVKNRAVKPKDIDFAKKKGLPYMEISSKANFNVKELILETVKALLGTGTQLTDEIALEKATTEVDEATLSGFKKEYEEASN
ncbi:gsp2p [Phaffia rhodozyma]|uniref:GSP1 n=1 Tax=Phaffia rhodozyma TaxID=264483 RepID=A0A0F7SFB6_PHARH|nr:GSP1 [Phaffia rhodozyma]CDZ96920.1 gsp2p [Phaffia rhodozyma]